jgi:hypothetical protein
VLLELPKGSSKLTKLSLHVKAYITLGFPIQWDGSYITIQSLNLENRILTILRLSVSGSAATVVGKTELRGAAMAVWIQDGNTVITGRYPNHLEGHRNIAFYNYPGGRLRSVFRGLEYKENQILFLAVATLPSDSHKRKWKRQNMNALRLNRYTSAMLLATGMLAGCNGSQPPMGAPNAMPESGSAHGQKHTKTFDYVGGEQYLTVPTGVTKVTVTADGASGGTDIESASGAQVTATIPVTPTETLYVFVGGAGSGYNAGFNGGGEGGLEQSSTNNLTGFAGGGASDIRQGGDALSNRVVVAGGGGGAGGDSYASGGAGGARKGGSGGKGSGKRPAHGGRGGTQKSGGAGGRGGDNPFCLHKNNGNSGTLGIGGNGGFSCSYYDGGGGGAGGGYYGGGGGGGGGGYKDGAGAGGGGGSSYVETAAHRVSDSPGAAPAGNGQIIIIWYK